MKSANKKIGFHDRCPEAPAQEDPQPLRERHQQSVWQEIKKRVKLHLNFLAFSYLCALFSCAETLSVLFLNLRCVALVDIV